MIIYIFCEESLSLKVTLKVKVIKILDYSSHFPKIVGSYDGNVRPNVVAKRPSNILVTLSQRSRAKVRSRSPEVIDMFFFFVPI